MALTLLSIQSHVVYGHVGNSSAVFPLQRLGAEMLPLNTVQFSNNTGYPGWRGRAFTAAEIDDCVTGLGEVGAIGRCDGVLSGYLGKAEVGEAVLRAVAAVRAAKPAAVYCCDPVIGDVDRGVYVEAGVADFFRRRGLPAATVTTPNAFELAHLTGLAVDDLAGGKRAIAALQALGPRVVLATSLRLADTPADALDLIAAEGDQAWRLRAPLLPVVLNGAGDLIAALFFFHWLNSGSAADALAAAASSVHGILAATAAAGARELKLVEAQDELVRPTLRLRPEAI